MACGWQVSYAGCPGSPTDPAEGEEDETRAFAEEMATDLLDRWTGGVYGVCEAAIRPCRTPRDDGRALREFLETTTGPGSGTPWSPVLIDGSWFNIGCGGCGGRCSCVDGTRALSLPWPVDSVTEVLIDGAVVPPSAYRVDAKRTLVRTDGGAWPLTQDLAADPTQPDTFLVTFMRGLKVPVGGQVAAGVLAEEFRKALCGDEECALPKRVQTVTRQGVTVAMLDGFEDLDDGRVGIWLVDSWVASVTRPKRPGRVHSPDVRGGARATRL